MSLDSPRQWTKRLRDPRTGEDGEFLTSTDSALVPIPDLIDAFAQEMFYWASPLPEQDMRRMLDGSLNFGLYRREYAQESTTNGEKCGSTPVDIAGEQYNLIGFARLVTDEVTFAFLTDVYVLPEYQGSGLGSWMLKCMDEVVGEWPHLRRIILFTSYERSKVYYEKLLDVLPLEPTPNFYILGKKGPGLGARWR